MIDRRSFLSLIAALSSAAAHPAWAGGDSASGDKAKAPAPPIQLGQPQPFSRDQLVALAKTRAQSDYVAPQQIPQEWIDLTYDQYRGIGFKPESGLWKNTKRPINVEFFAPGLYFPSPVSISVVEGDEARPVLFSKDVFNFAHLVPGPAR